eukprot:c18580_g1_i1.p1 GENE.c18580_g1_i1~~c18580_g1_i1.p1  ORF type:complete len:451 (+),score=72.86 c18580_g1_i1:502-1854(+)
MKIQTDALKAGVDVAVATPGRLKLLMDEQEMFLSRLCHFIIDEADTLLSAGSGNEFGDEVRDLLTSVMASTGSRPQLCLTSATLTRTMQAYLRTTPHLSHVQIISTKDTHRPNPNLSHKFLRILGPADKHSQLLATLRSGSVDDNIMIFCNTVACCRSTDHFLREQGFIKVASYHGQMPPDMRAANYERFTSGAANILVCTDIAARGLDTMAVNHVIMFDFPLNAVDYLHRAGRTGRMQQPGRVTCLVGKRDLSLANSIQRASPTTDLTRLSRDTPTQRSPRPSTRPGAAPYARKSRQEFSDRGDKGETARNSERETVVAKRVQQQGEDVGEEAEGNDYGEGLWPARKKQLRATQDGERGRRSGPKPDNGDETERTSSRARGFARGADQKKFGERAKTGAKTATKEKRGYGYGAGTAGKRGGRITPTRRSGSVKKNRHQGYRPSFDGFEG